MDNKIDEKSNYEVLVKYVETLTHSGLDNLDTALLCKVKNLCKKEPLYIQKSFELIVKYLKKKHAEVRLSSFQLCAELFKKSHAFRILVIGKLEQIIPLCIAVDPDTPLPPPKQAAEKLKKLCLLTVYEWKTKYGSSYKPLLLCYNYFAQCKHVPFEATQQEVAAEENVRIERERQVEKVRQDILQTVLDDMKVNAPEIENSLKTVDNCISLLLPPPEDFFVPTSDDVDFTSTGLHQTSDESDDFMRLFGLRSSYSLQIEINPSKKVNVNRTEENGAIIDNLRENLILLKKRHANFIKKWSSKLTTCGEAGEISKAVDELKKQSDDCFKKYDQLRVDGVDLSDDDDDDDFEEVDKEGYEPAVLPIFGDPTKVGESSRSVTNMGSSSLASAAEMADNVAGEEEPKEIVPDWQDPELLARLKEATGIDLKMPDKKKKGKTKKPRKRKLKVKEHNFPGITNLLKLKNTTKQRLKKKLFSRATLRRMSQILK